MQVPYRKIVLPNLVEDVKSIFWDHIHPYGLPKESRMLRAVKINEKDPAHQTISGIPKKYPFLDYHLLIFIIPPNQSTLIHLDGMGDKNNRGLSCNIPVSGCTEQGLTEFFDADITDFYTDHVRTTRFIKPGSSQNKVFEYSLTDNPVLCDTQYPHRVNNIQSSQTRISVSWTTRPDWTWDMISDYVAKQDQPSV